MIKWSLLLFCIFSEESPLSSPWVVLIFISYIFNEALCSTKLWESVNEYANNISLLCLAKRKKKREIRRTTTTHECLKAGSRAWTKNTKCDRRHWSLYASEMTKRVTIISENWLQLLRHVLFHFTLFVDVTQNDFVLYAFEFMHLKMYIYILSAGASERENVSNASPSTGNGDNDGESENWDTFVFVLSHKKYNWARTLWKS